MGCDIRIILDILVTRNGRNRVVLVRSSMGNAALRSQYLALNTLPLGDEIWGIYVDYIFQISSKSIERMG